MKKGQVTIFVIIAILIIAVIILFFALRPEVGTKNLIPKEIQPIDNSVMECLRLTSENALVRIGNQGGYFLIFDEQAIYNRIPYYFDGNLKIIPTQEEVEQNLEGFVYNELSFCILNFKNFRNEFEIKHDLKEVDVEILNENVRFALKYNLNIFEIVSNTSYQLNDFVIEIPIRLNRIYEVTQKIVNEQSQHPKSICLSCLYDLGSAYNMHIDMLDYGNSTIFTIIDDDSKINNQSYEWDFAIK
jgi:hypothetical protein